MYLKSKLTLCNLKGVIFMAVKAQGAPTKEYFVGMLTRDIELSDAILDLLDNCLDGVVRQKKGIDKTTTSDYYVGFFPTFPSAKILSSSKIIAGESRKMWQKNMQLDRADLLQKRQKTCLRSVFMASE